MSKYKDKKPSMIEFTRKYFLCNNIYCKSRNKL